jgi:hypothetical protein
MLQDSHNIFSNDVSKISHNMFRNNGLCSTMVAFNFFSLFPIASDYLLPKKEGACCYPTPLVLIHIDKLIEQIFIEIIDVLILIFIMTSLDGVG